MVPPERPDDLTGRRAALVTGGTGFVGSHIADALAANGWSVRILDVSPPTRTLTLAQEFVHADIRDQSAMRSAVAGCEVVVDNAALVPVTRATPAEYRSVNVDGCRTTLDAARAEGAYVVHVSSTSIFGSPEDLPVTEDTPLRPFEPYGASKAEAELVVQNERDNGLEVASLRPRAVLGRGRLGVFEFMFARIRANKRVPLFGSGSSVIQMCDARDFSAALIAAIERRANGNYNIGAADYGTVREDMQALIERVNSRSRLQPVPIWLIRATLQALDAVNRSPFTQWHWHAAAFPFYSALEKARSELDWSPRYSNVDALENAYMQYLTGAVGQSPQGRPLRGLIGRLLRG